MLRWIGLAAASCVVMCSDIAVAKRGNKKKWKDKQRKDDEYYKFKKKERKKRKKAIGVEGEDYLDHGHVVHLLHEDNFDHFVHLSDKVLVMFYAPWDKRTAKIQPAFLEAAVEANIKRNGEDGVLAALDCHQYPDLCLTLEVQKIPSIYLFENARVDAVFPAKTRKATAEHLLSFLTNADDHPHGYKVDRQPDPYTDISQGVVRLGAEEGSEDFDEFIHYHDQVFVQFYAHWCHESHKSLNEVLALADELKTNPELAVVGAVDCSANFDLCEYFQVSSTPNFKLFRNNPQGTAKEMITFHGHYDKGHFLEFIQTPDEYRMYGVPDDVMQEIPDEHVPHTFGKVHNYNFQEREQWNQDKAAKGETRSLPSLDNGDHEYTLEQIELQKKYGYGGYSENSADSVRERARRKNKEKMRRKKEKRKALKREKRLANQPPQEPDHVEQVQAMRQPTPQKFQATPNYVKNKKIGIDNIEREGGFNKYGIRQGGPSFHKVPTAPSDAMAVPDIYTQEQNQQQQQYGYERGARQNQDSRGAQQYDRASARQQQQQQQQQQQPDAAEAKRQAYQAYLNRQQRTGGGGNQQQQQQPEQTYIPPEGGRAPEQVDTVQSAGGMKYNIINN